MVMNHIEIKYSYFSQKAEFLMNREKVSPYSELASIGNSPFLEAVASIMKLIYMQQIFNMNCYQP